MEYAAVATTPLKGKHIKKAEVPDILPEMR